MSPHTPHTHLRLSFYLLKGFFCCFSLLLLRVKGRGCHTLLKPYETNCGLWIWAIQIKFDWLIDWMNELCLIYCLFCHWLIMQKSSCPKSCFKNKMWWNARICFFFHIIQFIHGLHLWFSCNWAIFSCFVLNKVNIKTYLFTVNIVTYCIAVASFGFICYSSFNKEIERV